MLLGLMIRNVTLEKKCGCNVCDVLLYTQFWTFCLYIINHSLNYMWAPLPRPSFSHSLTQSFFFLFFICKVNLVARLLLRLHYSGLLFITTASLAFRPTGATFSTGQLSSFPRSAHLRQTGNEKPAHTPVGDSRGGLLGFYWEGRNFEYNLLSPLSFFSWISPSGSKNRRRTRALPWIAGWWGVRVVFSWVRKLVRVCAAV